MKYPVDTIVLINNREWRVAEYRMGRGREWVYTLANERTDGSYDTMRLNELAIGKISIPQMMPYQKSQHGTKLIKINKKT